VNPFQKFVSESARVFQSGKKIVRGHPKKIARVKISSTAPTALLFSPHPDDECITGALALRLLREAKWNITNVAVTLGSEKKRQVPRLRELKNACHHLGFALIGTGLENINLETREKNPARWQTAVDAIVRILKEYRPRVIFIPHEADAHLTHIGVHFLVLDALIALSHDFECFVAETEFWGQMTKPNLLIESGVKDVADLVAALACHVGEVRRNPYHARLPAGMLDNVRRGAELVVGPGGAAPDFTFGTIYRLRKWSRGRLADVLKNGKCLSRSDDATGLFR
jgi:LmbE family N-acetylglucosaminyl deacetylase